MINLKQCSIVLDQPTKTYFPGQTVNGNVSITFNEKISFRGIHISFIGIAHTEWQQPVNQTYIWFIGNEQYFNIKRYLIGDPGSNETTLPAGTYLYNFSFDLPPILPSSFKGQFGVINYAIVVGLDRKMKFDKCTYIFLNVVSPIRNVDATFLEPLKHEMYKQFGCCCCKSRMLTANTFLPRTAYAPGSNIPVIIECDNPTKVKLEDFIVCINKVMVFHAGQSPTASTRYFRIKLNEFRLGEVKNGESKTFNREIPIPNFYPISIDDCSIIDLYYELYLEAKFSATHMNLRGAVPLKIINNLAIPEIGSNNQYPAPPTYDESLLDPQTSDELPSYLNYGFQPN